MSSIYVFSCPICGKYPKMKVKEIKKKENYERSKTILYEVNLYCKHKKFSVKACGQSKVETIGLAYNGWNEIVSRGGV